MADIVLDAPALLCFLAAESGAEQVAEALPGAVISAANLSEVVAKLCDKGMPEVEVRQALGPLPIEVAPFDEQQAYQAGLLRGTARASGLSLGDRACLGLARKLGLPALTTDRSWAGLDVRVQVQLVR